jgi:hypothetical protein
MVKDRKPAKVLYKFDIYPDTDKLSDNGNELEPKPVFFQLHGFHHFPGIIIWYQGLPGGD